MCSVRLRARHDAPFHCAGKSHDASQALVSPSQPFGFWSGIHDNQSKGELRVWYIWGSHQHPRKFFQYRNETENAWQEPVTDTNGKAMPLMWLLHASAMALHVCVVSCILKSGALYKHEEVLDTRPRGCRLDQLRLLTALLCLQKPSQASACSQQKVRQRPG